MFELKAIPDNLKPALTSLFSSHVHVDLAIQSILEGQTGAHIAIKVNDPGNPVAAQLLHGTFTVFAGTPDDAIAMSFIRHLKSPCAIQPSPGTWINLIKANYPDNIQTFTRYSFTHTSLNKAHLQSLIDQHPLKGQVKKLDERMAIDLSADDWGQYHFMNYNSPQHFIQKGIGYGVMVANKMAAACTSALVCSTGIELNIITDPHFRKKRLATLVAARLILDCLENGLEPHWDAANTVSKELALKLGYTMTGEYPIVVYK
jgi:hypothetical protein